MTVEAWLVIDTYRQRAVFLEYSKALLYAAKVRGIIIELVRK